MNVLIDYHHTDLAESLHRLFERIGFIVYVPDGLDWFEQGYWQFGRWTFGDDRLGRQFLLAPAVDDLNPTRTLNRISLDEARGMDFDVVVATVPDNYEGYRRFAQEKDARFCIEIGNVNQPGTHDALILDSTGVYPGGVQFTPEFDLDAAFHYGASWEGQHSVASFVNLFPHLPCFPLWSLTRAELPSGWEALIYGHDGPDGFIKQHDVMGMEMRLQSFGWHDKVTGDGFGYVIHYWAAVGRPLIGHGHHYIGQKAGWMWDDLVTCIDLDKHTPAETAALMESIANSDRLEEMGETLSTRLRERIDFAADAARVADALGLAVPA